MSEVNLYQSTCARIQTMKSINAAMNSSKPIYKSNIVYQLQKQ